MDIDPNDLLSTNVFINQPILEETVSDETNEEFKRFYISNKEKQEEDSITSKLKLRKKGPNESNNNNESNYSNYSNESNYSNYSNESNESNNELTQNKVTNKVTNRYRKDIKTLVSIDSRDRNKTTYPLPSNFKIFLGRTFYNVREVKLVSVEFPNTDAVINSKNNLIYWRNQEDIQLDIIDNITKTYPVYKATLRTGSYVINSLQTELTTELGLIKRSNPNKPYYHYFVVTLDYDTDVVTFISLILSQLTVNPLTTLVNTGIITVNAPNHGFTSGQEVYILGATTVAGIPGTKINGFQKVSIISSAIFQFEVNINASETLTGGGNVVKTGTQAPFQFLYGEYSNTVAQNIGYPLENSSNLISTNLSSIRNYYLIEITMVGGSFETSLDYIGNTLILQNTGGYLDNNGVAGNSIDGVNVISNVLSTNTILVSLSTTLYNTIYVNQIENNDGTGSIVTRTSGYIVGNVINSTESTVVLQTLLRRSDNYYKGWWIRISSGNCINNVRLITDYVSLTNTITVNSSFTSDLVINDTFYLYSAPTLVFNSSVYSISTIKNYSVNCILYTFFTSHNYNYSDISIGTSVTFYNTTTNPVSDGSKTILGIPSSNSFYTVGHLLTGGDATTTTPGAIGYISSHNLLTTKTLLISNVEIAMGSLTYIITTTQHDLTIGDSISINNLIVTPILSGVYTVHSIPDAYTFTIDFVSTNIDVNSISSAYIGTDLVTLTFPGHGFNTIISVANDISPNTAIITTQLPHNLTSGSLVRIMQTGISYIDNNSYTITYVSSDTFQISVTLPSGYILNSTTGILGMSNSFRLYGCPTIGGINASFLNNVQITINKIIDANTLNFHLYNAFATLTVTSGNNVYISSFLHGFTASQKNTKNNILSRSINLEGENYSFLCCPQLSSMLNTGNVKDIFARIILDQAPGTMVFNFLSNPKTFEIVPLDKLDTLDFSILNYDNSYYIFNDLDFSFTLEITEVVDTSDNFNISSKRGITDTKKDY